jgi:hypothetical protein
MSNSNGALRDHCIVWNNSGVHFITWTTHVYIIYAIEISVLENILM